MLSLPINLFNGLNERDDDLLKRSHVLAKGGYQQIAGIEVPDMENIDFVSEKLVRRKGTKSIDDPQSDGVMLTGDIFTGDSITWNNPVTGENIQVVVSQKTIYLKEGTANWKQAKDSTGADFLHSSIVEKATFAMVDGHLFIGTDGANNYIQVYRSGNKLDQELKNGNTYNEAYSATTHTITGTWAKGCYLLSVVHTRLVFSVGNALIEYTPMSYTTASGIWDLANGGFYIMDNDIITLTPFTPQFDNSVNEVLYIGTSGGVSIITGFLSTDSPYKIQGSGAPGNYKLAIAIYNWVLFLTKEHDIIAINGRNVKDISRRLKTNDNQGTLDRIGIDNNSFAVFNKEKKQALFFLTETGSSITNNICIVCDFTISENLQEKNTRLLKWRYQNFQTDLIIDGNGSDTDDIYDGGDAAALDATDIIDGGHIKKDTWLKGAYLYERKLIGIDKLNLYEFNSGEKDLGIDTIRAYWKTPHIICGREEILKQWIAILIMGYTEHNSNLDIDFFLNRNTEYSKELAIPLYNDISVIDGNGSDTDDIYDGGDAAALDATDIIDGGEAIFVDEFGYGVYDDASIIKTGKINLRSRAIQIKAGTEEKFFKLTGFTINFEYGARINI